MLDSLLNRCDEFDFFAAVRLLKRYYRTDRAPVGEDYDPHRELAHFRALPSAAFATSDVAEFKSPPPAGDGTSDPPEMVVTFLGLTGANGALPQHYTRLLLSRLRERDYALRDFLDLFNHRLISLFYRAWEKNRLPVLYERQAERGDGDDPFTSILRCLVGMGTGGLQRRLRLDDRTFLYYAGQFGGEARPAGELQRVLQDDFAVPVQIDSFFGRWLSLDVGEQSRLGGAAGSNGGHNRLGRDVVLGNRVWDVQGSFRVRIGSLRLAEFRQFQPTGDRLTALCQLVRTFAGPEFAFDVQVLLARDDVPECRLESRRADGPRLGWNTWLRSKPFARDADDAVFELEQV